MTHKIGRSTLKAPRLQRVLKCLKRGGWWTAWSLGVNANACNAAEVISNLRFEGVKIEKRKVPGKSYCQWRIQK